MQLKCLLPLGLAALVFGCNYDPRPGARINGASASTPPAAVERRGIWIQPSEIIDCGATVGTSGKVTWNFADQAGIAQVQVNVQSQDSDTAIPFAGGGVQGSALTGPWLRPGLRFTALDAGNGRTLGFVELRAYPCG